MNLQDKKTFLEEFGNRVKRTRIEKGMTLEELANKIGYTTENARSSAQKIEAGRSDPPASKIRILAKVLDVSVGYLMGWDTAEYTALEDKTPETDFNKIFSDNLNFYLNLKGASQLDLAKYLGVSATSVTNWCRGLKKPRTEKIDKMCKYFNINRSDLMSLKPSEQQNKPAQVLSASEKQLMGYDFPAERNELFENCCSKETIEAAKLFIRLDALDQGRIIGNMEQMLKSDKYSIHKSK